MACDGPNGRWEVEDRITALNYCESVADFEWMRFLAMIADDYSLPIEHSAVQWDASVVSWEVESVGVSYQKLLLRLKTKLNSRQGEVRVTSEKRALTGAFP